MKMWMDGFALIFMHLFFEKEEGLGPTKQFIPVGLEYIIAVLYHILALTM